MYTYRNMRKWVRAADKLRDAVTPSRRKRASNDAVPDDTASNDTTSDDSGADTAPQSTNGAEPENPADPAKSNKTD